MAKAAATHAITTISAAEAFVKAHSSLGFLLHSTLNNHTVLP